MPLSPLLTRDLIDTLDWHGTPLGDRASWSQSLSNAVSLVQSSSFPMFVLWGRERTLIYNDAYVPILGELHPSAMGQPFFDVWPDVRETIDPIIEAALAGHGSYYENLAVQLKRGGRLEQAWFTFSYSPIADDTGENSAVLCVCVETTASILKAEREAFLGKLRDRLRPLQEGNKVIEAAQRALGEHLKASRVGYGSLDQTERYFTTANNWTDGSVPHHNGTHDLAGFGPAVHEAIRRGDTLVVRDLNEDELTPREVRHAFDALEIEAAITVSLIKAGRLVAVMYVHQNEPRHWSTEDVAIVEEVAEITWSAHEQALAEAAARESREALALLNEQLLQDVDERTAERDRMWRQSRDLLLIIDARWRMVAVNPAAQRLLGYDVGKITNTRFDRYVHPQDLTAVRDSIKAAASSPVGDFEARLRAKDGSWRWFSWSATPGNREAYVVGRDVTEEKLRQAKLEASEDARRRADTLYRAYFENTPEALFVVRVEEDGQFVVEDLNAAHEKGIGLKLADVRGKRVDDILPPSLAAQVIRSYRAVVRTGEVLQYREVFEINGDPQHWDTSLVPVFDKSGRVSTLIGASRNITPQVKAEEALRQSQKMEAMGQLTGGVAHDFNNLLTPIVGALDHLQRKGLGGEREQRLIAGAAQSADRARTLVQRLLAFARRQPLQAIAVDVSKLVQDMGELVASTTGPQIRVVVDAPDGLPAAMADPNQLEMAVLNLSVNARDAMPDGGTLRISVTSERLPEGNELRLQAGPYLKVSVADTGSGMDEATLGRAVEPFFSTKGVGRGTGLGLSMAHGLALQLGGALSIQSQPGLGTNVELWLPQSEAQPAGADQTVPQAAAARSGVVLLVDDEELVRASTADMLLELGYEVVEADSGDAALRMIAGGLNFDVLVTDHLMPGTTGVELAREVRELRPQVSVLVVSGYAEAEGIAQEFPALSKPFRRDELISMLTTLVGSERSGPPAT